MTSAPFRQIFDQIGSRRSTKLTIQDLRILTWKKHHKITLQRLRKIRIWTFASLVHQINSF